MTEPIRQAEPCIPCTDVWRLERLTPTVQGAYNALAKRGEIHVNVIRVNKKTGMAVIEYMSTLPPDWTREALKKQMK